MQSLCLIEASDLAMAQTMMGAIFALFHSSNVNVLVYQSIHAAVDECYDRHFCIQRLTMTLMACRCEYYLG